VALTAAGDLELRVGLGTPDLAGGAVLACFILSAFRSLLCLSRVRNRGFVLGDFQLDVRRGGAERFDPRAHRALALEQAFYQRPCLRGLSCRALMLSSESS
jgi:hypothetical protein